MQVAPGLAPVTVNTAGDASDAFNREVVTVPEVQVRTTGTVATLFGRKSLLTTIVLPLSVLVISQLPPSATSTQSNWLLV